MPWTSLLPQSGDRLASVEWWLWVAAVTFGVLAPASGLIAYQVGQHRGRLERAAAERQEAARRLREAAKRESAKPAEDLQAQPVSRQITPSQYDELVAALSGKKGARVLVAFVQGDDEGQKFAQDIASVLRASGWEVEGPSGATWTSENPIGHGIVVHDGNNPPPGAILLWGAFKAAGVPMGALVKPETPPDHIWIIVGNRG